jgi:hypothetical protein
MKPSPLAVLAVFLLAFFPARAGANDDALAAIAKCASLNDNTARLVCYDKIAGRSTTVEIAPQPQATPPAQTTAAVPQQPQASPPAQTAAAAPPAAKKDEESWFGIADWFGSDKASPALQTTPQQFGSESLPPPPAAPGAPPLEPLDHIAATVSDFAYNPFGRFVVFLDNGQIWQQIQGDTDQAHFSKSKKDQVTISRGLLGSYNLVIGDHSGLYKVKRIK